MSLLVCFVSRKKCLSYIWKLVNSLDSIGTCLFIFIFCKRALLGL